ncbi:hypothetical protein [Streptomyces canus]|uniref:hypothetical protein n=1 Tax=Streptomyces canus TaxID=58343 RepID=UPI003865E653|nr:hypothetical protein OH824_14205 [Streptomyces canus]
MASAETARFPTRSGRATNNDLKFTQVVHGITGYRLKCSACSLAGSAGPFRLQPDAVNAARTHANRCLA